MKRNRIPELDFLRSSAIILLLVHHSGVYQLQIGSFPLDTLSRYINHLLLGAFVFISGFLTVMMLYKLEITDLPHYYRSRLLRLYFPYLAALLLFITLLGIQVSPRELIIHLFGLQILLSPRYSDPILTLWFISLLAVFLFIAPILIVSIKRTGRLFTTYLIVFIISILIHNGYEIIDIRFIYLFPTFAIGSLIGVGQHLRVMKTSKWLFGGSLVGFCFGIYMLSQSDFTYIHDLDLSHVLWTTLYILSSIVLIIRVAQRLLRLQFISNLTSYTAISSFFAYLYHRPFWKLLNDLAGSYGQEIEVLTNLLSIPVIIIASYFLQNLYGKLLGKT